MLEDQKFREKLAEVEIELKALELTQLRVVADEGKHGKGKPNPASSVLKIKGSEIQQATTELLMEVIGPFAAPYDEHGDDGSNEAMDWTAQIAPSYFNNRKVSIYGGSNEIQRNIITKAVLGLVIGGSRNNNRCRPPRRRGTQYAAAVVLTRSACDYWIPAFAGMTTECRAAVNRRHPRSKYVGEK